MGGIRGRCVLCLALPDTWALGQVRCSEASYNLGPSPQKEEARRGFVCLRSPRGALRQGEAVFPGARPVLLEWRAPPHSRGLRPSRLPGCRCLLGVLGGSGLADAPPASASLASGPPSSPRGHRPPVRPPLGATVLPCGPQPVTPAETPLPPSKHGRAHRHRGQGSNVSLGDSSALSRGTGSDRGWRGVLGGGRALGLSLLC